MKVTFPKTTSTALVTIPSVCLAMSGWAGENIAVPASPPPVPAKSESSIWKQIFDSVVLYKNDSNPVIQKFALTGRAQFDYSYVDGDAQLSGERSSRNLSHDQFNTRRLRAGFKATLFEDFTLHAEADFDPDESPFYRRLTDVYLAWEPSEKFEVKVGKQSMGYTLDGKTSSKELLTIDRNNLTNNLWFTTEYLPGVTVGGKTGNWSYRTGVFSQGESDNEFGQFNAGTTLQASIGYDFAKSLEAKEARLALDYVYNEATPSSPALFTNRSLENIVSLNFQYEKDDFGFRADLAAGDGFGGQSDLWGIAVTPFYNITEKLQVVARYTFVESSSDNGVRFGGYEAEQVVGARGDQYQEGYLGLNYYIYGHKLKLQTGVQYLSMRDNADDGGHFDGLALTAGLRISW